MIENVKRRKNGDRKWNIEKITIGIFFIVGI